MKRFILTLFFVFSASMAMATTYNVSKSGSNANSCATAQTGGASAKLTIAAGVGCLSAGDTLVIAAGTYAEAIQNSIPSGASASARTVIKRNGTDTVILKPSGDQAGGAIIGHGAVNYVEIDGLELDGTNATAVNGIDVDDEASTGWYIHDVSIHDVDYHGLIIDGGSHTIANVSVVHAGFTTTADLGNGTNPGGGHCFYLHFHDSSISNSSANGCGQYGFHQYGTIGGRSNNILTGLTATNTGRSGVIIGSGTNNRLSNSIIYANSNGNSFGGILSNGSNGRIYNNTIYNNAGSCIYQVFGSGNIFANNLCSANGTNSITEDSTSGNTSTTNLTGTQTAASHFVDAAGGNFNLISTSAAVDAGTATIASGITRAYNGSAPDVGAHERFGVLNCEVGEVATNKLVCNFGMNIYQPILITDTTGWSWTGGTLSSVAVTGSAQLTFTLSGAYGGGASTISYTEASGNATDSALIGNSLNQRLSVLSTVSVTDNTGGAPAGSVGLSHWRIYLLQGSTDTAWIPKCTEDSTNCVVPPGAKLWIRYKLRNNSGSNYAAFNLFTKWRENGGTYYFPSDSFQYGYTCTNSIPPTCAPELNYIRVLGIKETQLGTVLSNGATLTADQLTSNETTNISCVANIAPTSIPSLTMNDSTEAECAQGVQVSASAPSGTVLEQCPYRDDGTALTCATPVKLTVGSYQSVR